MSKAGNGRKPDAEKVRHPVRLILLAPLKPGSPHGQAPDPADHRARHRRPAPRDVKP